MKKNITMYLTVRVDIEIPTDMDEADAKSDAVANLNYDFKLPKFTRMEVESTEICDVNDEL